MKKIAITAVLLFFCGCAAPGLIINRNPAGYAGKIKIEYVSTFGPNVPGYGFMASIKNIKAGGGRLYVPDGVGRVIIMNYNGVYQDAIGGPGSFTGILEAPVSAAFDAAGNIYILEQDACRVQKISRLNRTLQSFGSRGRDEKSLFMSSDMAVNSYGDIYVCDTGNDAVKKFDVFGNYISSMGHFGYGKGFLSAPSGIAADFSNNIFVLDKGNKRVQKFGPANDFLAEITGPANAGFENPGALAVDDSGNLFVADSGALKIYFFSNSGVFIGGFRLEKPFDSSSIVSIAIADGRYLFVADSASGKIHKFVITYE